MVVGSNKGFLSCILALKTKGSEAEARGEDPADLGQSQYDLVAETLELVSSCGSDATTVAKARTDAKFRSEGLLPLFSKANAEIKVSSQQARMASLCFVAFDSLAPSILMTIRVALPRNAMCTCKFLT